MIYVNETCSAEQLVHLFIRVLLSRCCSCVYRILLCCVLFWGLLTYNFKIQVALRVLIKQLDEALSCRGVLNISKWKTQEQNSKWKCLIEIQIAYSLVNWPITISIHFGKNWTRTLNSGMTKSIDKLVNIAKLQFTQIWATWSELQPLHIPLEFREKTS